MIAGDRLPRRAGRSEERTARGARESMLSVCLYVFSYLEFSSLMLRVGGGRAEEQGGKDAAETGKVEVAGRR